MAVEGRINVRHEDVFTQAVLLLSVDPVEDFDKKRAGVEDPQERDKTTAMRLWSASVLDPTAQQGRREIKVKIAADVQPVPPNGLLAPVDVSEGFRAALTPADHLSLLTVYPVQVGFTTVLLWQGVRHFQRRVVT